MGKINKIALMPTQTRYRLLITFCLTSLIPILSGVYVGSLFVRYPFDSNPMNLMTISLVILFSMLLSFLGHEVNKGLIFPIMDATSAAKRIALGELAEVPNLRGSDELEDLSHSLHMISKNAKELLEKVEKLSLKDKLTGLYKATYLQERLNEEIQRSIHYQRPCSFIYFHIDSSNSVVSEIATSGSEELLKGIAGILSRHLSEFDRAARINLTDFAVILTDTNKKSAIERTQAITLKVKEFLSGTTVDVQKKTLRVFAGISENPIDGVTADDLYVKAQDRMRLAKTKGLNIIEAFA